MERKIVDKTGAPFCKNREKSIGESSRSSSGGRFDSASRKFGHGSERSLEPPMSSMRVRGRPLGEVKEEPPTAYATLMRNNASQERCAPGTESNVKKVIDSHNDTIINVLRHQKQTNEAMLQRMTRAADPRLSHVKSVIDTGLRKKKKKKKRKPLEQKEVALMP